jgi:hypothetical protein
MGKPTFDKFRDFGLGLRAAASWISGYQKGILPEYIGLKSKPGELKHLSTRRKGHQPRLR